MKEISKKARKVLYEEENQGEKMKSKLTIEWTKPKRMNIKINWNIFFHVGSFSFSSFSFFNFQFHYY